jgi:MerR family redox-sensitive transcriptional activator SoxR
MALQKTDLLVIGEVASRTGVAVSAIRFYEERGFVSAHRSTGGRRMFARADIRRIAFVQAAQRLGFSLAEIGAALDTLPTGRAPTKRDWTRLASGFRDRLDERIAHIERLREKLDGCIGCGCLSLTDCALYNREDEAAREGPGAKHLRPT